MINGNYWEIPKYFRLPEGLLHEVLMLDLYKRDTIHGDLFVEEYEGTIVDLPKFESKSCLVIST